MPVLSKLALVSSVRFQRFGAKPNGDLENPQPQFRRLNLAAGSRKRNNRVYRQARLDKRR